MKKVGVFVLAKNEQDNIWRCLNSLSDSGWKVNVLDSGSTDSTGDIVESFSFSELTAYNYVNHCESYNDILTKIGCDLDYALILDADMVVGPGLRDDINRVILSQDNLDAEAFLAPVQMWVEGRCLQRGSLYPPKPILFKVGRPLFESIGHGERLMLNVKTLALNSFLVHDDRKPYSFYLNSQLRYSENLLRRGIVGSVNWKDRLRLLSPLFVFVTPLFSLFFKWGIFCGKLGIIYALDRLIAEAIMYRQSLSVQVKESRFD